MKQILVGYGKQDITPDEPIGLSGYGNDATRLHRAVLDPISGICLALTDGRGQTALLFSVDLLLVDAALTEEFRCAVEEATGVPKPHIFLAATHNHSAPAVTDQQQPRGVAYRAFFIRQMLQAAKDAMADRVASMVETGAGEATDLCFTRHYINPDGSYFGDNFGTRQDPIAGHAGKPDRQIRLVRFCRKGKREILLINWQAHAKMCSTATSQFGKEHHYHLSADFIGYTRAAVEEQTGSHVIYFSGASGNLNPDSRIEEEAPPKEPWKLGTMLAAFVCGIRAFVPVAVDDIFCHWRQVIIPIDHTDDHKVELAKRIWNTWPTDPEGCKRWAKAEGFNSAYAARDVIRRHGYEESRKLELGVLRIGQLAFTAAPYEMFCDNGVYIKEYSPCEATVLMTCVNDYHKYIPSKRAYSHGCYEVDSRLYPEGTAEKLAEILVEELHNALVSKA